MLTAACEEPQHDLYALVHCAATDPIEPIHDYNIPILPFKHPPTREDFPKIRKRNPSPEDHKKPPPQPAGEGHVDDFA